MRIYILFFFALYCFACNNTVKENKSGKPGAPAMVSHDTLIANAPPDPKETAALIVPGKSIGLTAIGETAEGIALKLGPADEGDAAMGKSIGTWYSKSNRVHSTTIYFTTNFGDSTEAKRVSQVRINSPYFSTKDDIKTSSSFAAIQQSFPAIKETGYYTVTKQIKMIIRTFDDINAGIAFEIDPENICVGVAIHKPGEKAYQTYLPFMENYHPLD